MSIEINVNSWKVPKLFNFIQRKGNIKIDEMYSIFNMGIGMAAIVSGPKADGILRSIRLRGHAAWIIGDVTKGRGKVKLAQ